MIKNIVIINDFNYVQGGASKVAIQTAALLKDHGYNVYFFSAVYNDTSLIDGVKYIYTGQKEALKEKNKLKGFINGIYNFKAKKELKKLLNTLDKEDTIIHVHGWTKALSSSVFDIAFKLNFKVILTLHDYFSACPNGGYFNYRKNKVCNLKGNSIKCICTNCDSRNYLFKAYRIVRQFVQNNVVKLNKKLKYAIGISDLNINVLKKTLGKQCKINKVYNPIDIKDSDDTVDVEKNEYFLYVGRISKEKGVNIFCEIITQLDRKGIVVGDGSELKLLKEKYPNIEFVGWKNGDQVKEYISKARAFIFPSLWYEGAPLTPLEFMSQGVPCAISDVCAGREYIIENNGVVFNPYNIEDAKKKINYLDKNIKLMSKNSKRYFDRISKINYIDELVNVYNKMED